MAYEQDIARTIANADKFNNLNYVLLRSLPYLSRQLNKYKGRLLRIIRGSVQGGLFDGITDQAVEDFIKNAAGFIDREKILRREGTRRALTAGVRRAYADRLRGLVEGLIRAQRAKITSFKTGLDSFIIPDDMKEQARAALGGDSVVRFTVPGKGQVSMNLQAAQNEWDRLQTRYGRSDQVIFEKGNKLPLNTYITAKNDTVESEIHRAATVTMASQNGVFFGRVSQHGTDDSCILHEGEIVFMTQTAKDLFMEQFPQHAAKVRHYKTVQQLEEDPTHIFKFNCKHLVRPYMVQFFDEEDQEEELAGNVVQDIPQNFSEHFTQKAMQDGKIERGKKADPADLRRPERAA